MAQFEIYLRLPTKLPECAPPKRFPLVHSWNAELAQPLVDPVPAARI
jgi:hypothetical protein